MSLLSLNRRLDTGKVFLYLFCLGHHQSCLFLFFQPYGTPQRSATGFDQRRLNMLLAVLEKRVGFKLMQKDVFINIAGGLRVTDLATDLSVISAVLSSNVDTPIEPGWCMAGEVGLSGEVRPIARIEQRIAEAEKLGFSHIILPRYNMQGLNTKKFKIELCPVRKVEEALRLLFG